MRTLSHNQSSRQEPELKSKVSIPSFLSAFQRYSLKQVTSRSQQLTNFSSNRNSTTNSGRFLYWPMQSIIQMRNFSDTSIRSCLLEHGQVSRSQHCKLATIFTNSLKYCSQTEKASLLSRYKTVCRRTSHHKLKIHTLHSLSPLSSWEMF